MNNTTCHQKECVREILSKRDSSDAIKTVREFQKNFRETQTKNSHAGYTWSIGSEAIPTEGKLKLRSCAWGSQSI